jgi:ribosome biogenesis GTPase
LNAAGTIVAAFGRHYEIELADGRLATGYPKGKKSPFAVGDEIELTPDGQITGHATRRSLLYRSDAYRQKLIAANATQLLLVVATDPSFSDMLLSRALVAAEQQGLRSIIVLNKCDLARGPARRPKALLAPYIALGCRVIELSAKFRMPRPCCRCWRAKARCWWGKVRHGQIDPDQCPGAGRRRRRPASFPQRWIPASTPPPTPAATGCPMTACPGGTLIDSPGLQEFGLKHLTPGRRSSSASPSSAPSSASAASATASTMPNRAARSSRRLPKA